MMPNNDTFEKLLDELLSMAPDCGGPDFAEKKRAVVAEYERVCQIAGEQQIAHETLTAELTAERQRAEGLREALVLVMDHIPDHDIQAETGFPDEVCARIARIRRAALEQSK